MPTAVELNYSLMSALLRGNFGASPFAIVAYSGGRGGSTTPGAIQPGIMNNPFAMCLKTDHARGIHGGPLPFGGYTIATPTVHPHLGLSARLTPIARTAPVGMCGRDGFYIHGCGPHGSDGCIVQAAAVTFQTLMHLLTTSLDGCPLVVGVLAVSAEQTLFTNTHALAV